MVSQPTARLATGRAVERSCGERNYSTVLDPDEFTLIGMAVLLPAAVVRCVRGAIGASPLPDQ